MGISDSGRIDNYAAYASGRLHDVINLSTSFLQAYQHQLTSFSPFCKQYKDKTKANSMMQ